MHRWSFMMKENAILISQPYKDIPNVFEIKTNVDSGSEISLNITIEQYLQKRFNFNELTIQILRNFNRYNINPKYEFITFSFDVSDECGIYDVFVPYASFKDENININKINKAQSDNYDLLSFIFGKNASSTSGVNQTISSSVGVIIHEQTMDKFEKNCIVNGQIKSSESDINELCIKYKIKGEAEDSHCLYDNKSNTFCHIISNRLGQFDMNKKQYNTATLTEGSNEYPTTYMEGEGLNIKDSIVPRRVIFVIDKSGSMSGGKWRRTVSATINALNQLRKGFDRFNVILFNSDVSILWNVYIYIWLMDSILVYSLIVNGII